MKNPPKFKWDEEAYAIMFSNGKKFEAETFKGKKKFRPGYCLYLYEKGSKKGLSKRDTYVMKETAKMAITLINDLLAEHNVEKVATKSK